MCQPSTSVRGVARWNWDGDVIVHRCVVASSRPVVGTTRRGDYDTDIREFLVTERNELMRRTLHEDVRRMLERPAWKASVRQARSPSALDGWAAFQARQPGCFDFRVAAIASWVGRSIRYRKNRADDPWRFPDETLHLREGDCEDLSFLLVSMCLAAGVSPYNLRVALGQVTLTAPGRRARTFDHVWVVYKAESGAWTVVEPLARVRPVRGRSAGPGLARREGWTATYLPWFVFNDSHLWEIRRPGGPDFEELLTRRARGRWRRFQPSFAGSVHQSVLTHALTSVLGEGHWFLDQLHREFTSIPFVGETVEAVDADVPGYDPRDHFDNAYIGESWARVRTRLAAFAADNLGGAHEFALAAHGIADFYAHSNWAHEKDAGAATVPLHPGSGDALPGARYTSGPYDLEHGTAPNPRHAPRATPAAAAAHFADRVVSGRYAQRGDGGGFFERITYLPRGLEDDPSFYWRGFLPRHDAVAVDKPERPSAHVFSAAQYKRQYALRYDAAVRHVRAAFQQGWRGGP
ncbi:MAG: transglutaminase domain-containing protein [Planctomycetes bacterium]|nr:transglutaminase domain-containing protein [Planctomycetota bacterium]